MDESVKTTNVSAEMSFVGSLFSNPDLYVSFGSFMRPKYDFSDAATRFFYDSFEIYYLTYSREVDETRMNVFMAQDQERLKQYKQYRGWKTIQDYMRISDYHDCQNYFDIVKKYSLLREYERNGFPADKILKFKNFDKLKADDIYRIIRSKADQIHTVINSDAEAINLGEGIVEAVNSYIDAPAMGLLTPWYLYNEMMLGLQREDVMFEGFLSNEGKTRKLIMLAAYVVYVQKKDFLFMSNEMSAKKLKSCLITTLINNKEFKDSHGINLHKPEREITLGAYKDDLTGDYIRRKVDDQGAYIESNEEFRRRIEANSEEYKKVMKISKWIDEFTDAKLLFLDIGDDYSDDRIERELRKYSVTQNVIYYGYDTMKGYRTDDWSAIKQTATKLKEVTKELKMSGFAVYQLSDDTVYTDIFSLSSNNIANSKHMKHVVDVLTMGKKIELSDYHKYEIVLEDPTDQWGSPVHTQLDRSKTYFAIKVDKNRSGNKDKIMAFVIDLDYNTWECIGYFVKKK